MSQAFAWTLRRATMETNVDRQVQSDKTLLRRRQVEQLVQLSRSTIYASVKAGTFPAPIRIGVRAVAWRKSCVESWLEARPLASATV
jgi:prophage regulatory protein